MSLSKKDHNEEKNKSLEKAAFYVLEVWGFFSNFLSFFFSFARAKIAERLNVLMFCIAYAPLSCKDKKKKLNLCTFKASEL